MWHIIIGYDRLVFMEGIKPFSESFDIPPNLFKSTKTRFVESFLREKNIDAEDFTHVAKLISKDSEVLFSRYHNLFSLQQDKSIDYLKKLIQTDLEREKNMPSGSQHSKVQYNLEVANEFLSLVQKYNWYVANKVVYILEECLI